MVVLVGASQGLDIGATMWYISIFTLIIWYL